MGGMKWEQVNRQERVTRWDRENGRLPTRLHCRHDEARDYALRYGGTSDFLAGLVVQARPLSDRQVEAVLAIKGKNPGRLSRCR